MIPHEPGAALPLGAHRLDDGRYAFHVWAPDARQEVLLELDNVRHPLTPQGEGRYMAKVEAAPGTRYRYRVDGLAVPDPAAHLQHEEWSVLADPKAYTWQHNEWLGRPWAETVIYELHVGTLGGFDGVREALPALAALGITAIELMPIASVPGRRNWGYDAVLLYAVQGAYGSPESLKAMVDAAHGLGIQVFLDVVYNHFGPVGNWLPHYASDFFTEAQHTPWGAAIDFDNPIVSEFFIQNALYWLHEYRFDGLRLDAVHTIYNDEWLRELSRRVRISLPPGRHVHLVLENERNDAHLLEHCYDGQWADDFHHALHVMLTGERGGFFISYSEDPARHLARCLKEGFSFQGEPSPLHEHRPRGAPSAHLPPARFIPFLQNHDQIGNRPFGERMTLLAPPAKLKAAVALLLLCPQIPMLFMGEEWGCTEPFLFFTDHDEELAQIVREGRKREFAHFTEHSDPERAHTIPDPNDEASFTRSFPGRHDPANAEQRDWLAHYGTLLALRHRDLVPHLTGAWSVDSGVLGPAAVAGQWRLANGSLLTLILNLGEALHWDASQQPAWLRTGTAAPAHYATPLAAASALAGGTLPADSCLAWLTGASA